jgi:flagellar basal-body rod protein FlgC
MSISGIFSGMDISASGMQAQRMRQNAISSNLANVETTRTAEGGPYRRQFALLEAQSNRRDIRILNQESSLSGTTTSPDHIPIPSQKEEYDRRFFGNGVRVAEIREDSRPPKMVHNPGHPDADSNGYVAMPNVNTIEEMVDMISATRAYEANATAFNATKNMMMQALQM